MVKYPDKYYIHKKISDDSFVVKCKVLAQIFAVMNCNRCL